ncbi:hypothetical protein DDV21_011005 [Streptococcus chenjunshii]|uniref:Uncharacterized protein n=1 Tax=Streptococcus chenjunshii TaxID=2173853 RepID=A0A372KMQ8_9STRE|nr:hypothetical protein [Streptococcus chenjunshii]AXQ79551.1 hypothetical protein DDV21_011005 [Streptococcus chenjunshii]RFU51466.1 hypothetical protein DDV22_03060 [Streptococcus chenjunshii]RFU53553.1 hypothetical protein DDV23_04185 [Streptococcus chenjunshii]
MSENKAEKLDVEKKKDWERLLIKERLLDLKERVRQVKLDSYQKTRKSVFRTYYETLPAIQKISAYAQSTHNDLLSKQVQEAQGHMIKIITDFDKTLEEVKREKYRLEEEQGYIRFQKEQFLKREGLTLAMMEELWPASKREQ